MAAIGVGVGPSSAETWVPAFAKLQGKDFQYYMRKYSIIVGRNSKKAIVDLDLGNHDGGGFAVSRRHARIYYDFPIKRFALEVLGRNGCLIRNVLFKPGSPPIKLNSQDLIQVGEVRFYFLLPTRPFLETLEAAWKIVPPLMSQSVASPTSNDEKGEETEHDRKEAVAEVHISGSIVREFSAREAGVSSSEQPGDVKSASQTVQSKLSQLTVAPHSASTCEMKVEEKGNDIKESLANGRGECGVSGGRTVKEINAREAEGSSGVLSGPFDAARQMAPPTLLKVPLAYSKNVRMEHEREHDEEHIVRIDHGKGIVSGLIVEEFNASKAEGSSGILAGALGATKKTGASLPPPLVELPLVSVNDVRKGGERLLDRGEIFKESDSAEAKRSSGLSSGTLKAAQEITVHLSAQFEVVPPTSLNNVRQRKGWEENLGIVHGENAASGLVMEFNAGDIGVLSNKQSGTLEAAMQVEPPLSPEPVVDLLTASTGQEEDGDLEKRSGSGPGEGDASGLIVEELNAEDSVPSLPPQLTIVPLAASNDERKGEEVEGDGEESKGTGQESVAVTVTGFIVQDFNTKEAVGLSGEQFGVLEDASQITSPALPQPVVVPLTALNNENDNVGKEGESEENAGVGQAVGDAEEAEAAAEDPSGGLSGTFEAARKVASPLPCPLVVFLHTYSNGEGKCEEKDGGGKGSVGSGHSEAGVGGLNVELDARVAEGSSDMLSGGMKQFCLSGSKLEGKSRSTGEADNQDETPDLHVFRVNLPGINKEQIKLELEDGKIWIQISAEHAIENMDKTDNLWICVEDSGCKFLKRHLVLPKNVKIDQIKAVLEDGVLTVTVPKGDVETPAQSEVESIEISDKSAE